MSAEEILVLNGSPKDEQSNTLRVEAERVGRDS